MAMCTGSPVIGVGLPQAGPSDVLMTVPRSVRASSERSDVPGAAVPFLESTASGRFTDPAQRPSFRWASHVTASSPTTCAQSDPHRLTVGRRQLHPNSATAATVRSILMRSPCRTRRSSLYRRCPYRPAESRGASEDREIRPAENRCEQNAEKTKIADCAGCAHKSEPLVKET